MFQQVTKYSSYLRQYFYQFRYLIGWDWGWNDCLCKWTWFAQQSSPLVV